MAEKASAKAPVEAPVPPQPNTEVPPAPTPPTPPAEAVPAEATAPVADAQKPEAPPAPEPKVLVKEGELLPEAPQAPDTNDRTAHVQHRKDTVVESLAQLVGGKITGLVEEANPNEDEDFVDQYNLKTYGLQIEIEQIQGPNIIFHAWIQADAEGNGPGFLAIENKGARRG